LLEGEEDYLILASALVEGLSLEGYKVVQTVLGRELNTNIGYEPLFNPHEYEVERRRPQSYISPDTLLYRRALEPQPPYSGLTYRVISGDCVSMGQGTGIVHIAPAFGEVDFETGEDVVQPVDLQGRITGTYPFAGKFVKDADPLILEDLKSRGLLYRSEIVRHTYPFCWRCSTPLLYYAKPSWYIKTTAKKAELIAGNEEINWYPEHIKRGRFGDWLENNVDWAVSRERYWGTPLPIWRCESCGKEECIGGIEELKSGRRNRFASPLR